MAESSVLRSNPGRLRHALRCFCWGGDRGDALSGGRADHRGAQLGWPQAGHRGPAQWGHHRSAARQTPCFQKQPAAELIGRGGCRLSGVDPRGIRPAAEPDLLRDRSGQVRRMLGERKEWHAERWCDTSSGRGVGQRQAHSSKECPIGVMTVCPCNPSAGWRRSAGPPERPWTGSRMRPSPTPSAGILRRCCGGERL
jgi:hypothetical protein